MSNRTLCLWGDVIEIANWPQVTYTNGFAFGIYRLADNSRQNRSVALSQAVSIKGSQYDSG